MVGKGTTKLIGLITFIILIACTTARAGDSYTSLDELARYFQRIDTGSVVSGDAKDANAVTQIINPWPRYARVRRIPANGQRMVGAINRYQNPRLLGAQAPTLAPIIMQNLQGGGGGGADQGGAAGTGGGY
jgi:hypothetical protein